MKPLTRIRLRLLGRFAISFVDRPDPIRLSSRKSGALLAYLAMSPEQTARREELAALLWDRGSDQQARQSVRQALALLRKELGEPHLFAADTEVVGLQPGLWSVDAREFENLSKSSDADDLNCAARLFNGEFLTGLNIEEEGFDEWVNAQRQRMQIAAARLCETCAAGSDLAVDGDEVIAVAERLLALDPLREDWQRTALTLYARHRGKSEALAQAEIFAAQLRRELDVAPEAETRTLVERIRAGDIAPAAIARARPNVSAPGAVDQKTALNEASAATEVPEVHCEEGVEPADAPGPGSSLIGFRRWPIRRLAAGLMVAALVIAGGSYGLWSSRPVSAPTDPVTSTASMPQAAPSQSPQPSSQTNDKSPLTQRSGVAAVLVLPFTIVGESSERSTLLADLMTDDLTNLLGRVGGFRVIARQTAMSYRDLRIDPVAVGKDLGVGYLLEGSVQAQGESVLANVELVDAKNGLHVWSGRFERTGADFAIIQEEIVHRIGRELQIEVTRVESGRDPRDLGVHGLIYKGFTAISDAGRLGAPALEQAEKYFSQALAREPDNTRAMTGLGAYHVNMAAQLLTADPAPHLAKAEVLLRQVIERRPDVGGPSLYMGLLNMARGHVDVAITWFEREIERNPSQPNAYAQLGRALGRTGKPEEGLKHILYAMRLSPRDPAMPYWLGFAGGMELEFDRYDKAIEYLDRALALQPNQPRTQLVLVAAYALTGRLADARTRLEQVTNALPHLSKEKVTERFLGKPTGPGWGRRLKEGLGIVLAPAADPWAPPQPAKAPGEPAVAPNKSITPILVLPFKTFGEATGSTELLADMVADDLTNLLSRVQFLRVISRQTALTFKGQPVDVTAIGTELQVRYVLDGSMRMQGDKLRVNIELIDPKSRLPVWSTRIEREGADRYGILDEIVARIERELQLEILPIESARRSNDVDADALVYQGWNALFDISQDSYRRAESYFRQALERDPQSLAAQIGLGAYHARMAALALDTESDAHRARALEILRAALQRAPQSSTAYFYIGLALNKHATLLQSIEAMQRAIELDPSHPSAYAYLGHGLSRMGKPAEGLEYIRYAMRLSPRDPTMAVYLEMVGNAELELQHYDAAIENFQRATVLKPGNPHPWAGLVAAHALAGHADEARRCAEKLEAFVPSLSAELLIDQFGGNEQSRTREGLRLVLARHANSGASPH